VKVAYLLEEVSKCTGTSGSVSHQLHALAGELPARDLSVISVESSGSPFHPLPPEVTLVGLVDRSEEDPDLEHPSRLVEDSLPDGRAFTRAHDVAVRRHLAGLEADVLVTTSPATLALAAQSLRPGVALVHQEHDATSQRGAELDAVLRFAGRADVVAVTTQAEATWWRSTLGDRAPRIVVVPHPLPPEPLPQSDGDQPVVMAAGRLSAAAQHRHLITAFRDVAPLLPDWRLRIFGAGPRRRLLADMVREFGLQDRVELAGQTADLAAEWARAGIAVLPARGHDLPLSLLEAMAAGVPVVSYDCPTGPRELVTDGVDGVLVENGSPAVLAAALLAQGPAARRELGARGRETVQRYAAAPVARQWASLFAELLDGPDATAAGSPSATPPTDPPVPAVEVSPSATPHEMRAVALRAVRGAASDAGVPWLAIPPHGAGDPVAVVAMADRDRFLEALARVAPPTLSLRRLELDSWPPLRLSVPAMAAAVASTREAGLVLEPWPADPPTHLAEGASLTIELWSADVHGRLRPPRPHEYVSTLEPGWSTVEVDVAGVTVPTLEPMTLPRADECRFPVDVVYTWVDGEDPEWNARRAARLAETGVDLGRTSSGQARFRNHDELRYSLRSVHLFAPWVRRIHLVTAGQAPAWLDTDHPGVRLVDHAEILPAEALPTFNSQAIETGLHRVPDLAEHFVYLNDDVLLGRPRRPEDFFSPGGLVAAFVGPRTIGAPSPDDPSFLQAAHNNQRLLLEAFGVAPLHTMLHSPHPQRRSVLAEIEERFADAVATTARAPFRSPSDISLLSNFAQHYGLITGQAYRAGAHHDYINIGHRELPRLLRLMLRREYDFFCLADDHEFALPPDRVATLLAEALEAYFPVRAPWELPGR
jgi:glycosyltransferase involved in cell wall biosynthesis